MSMQLLLNQLLSTYTDKTLRQTTIDRGVCEAVSKPQCQVVHKRLWQQAALAKRQFGGLE